MWSRSLMAGAGLFSSGFVTEASTEGARPADSVSTSTAVCMEMSPRG
jgi:hypothetical protein